MALTNLKSPIPKNLIDLLANALNKITTIAWGNITGTLSDQTDLQNALNAKQNTLSLTTNNTSGAATLVGSTLNVPNYTPAWGQITGTLSSQTDLQNALNAKENSITTLAITKGGTGTSTQFTQGSVPFAGASGVYSQDNANLFWDDSNNYLGVGVNTGLDANVTIKGYDNSSSLSLAIKSLSGGKILGTTNDGRVLVGNNLAKSVWIGSSYREFETPTLNETGQNNLVFTTGLGNVAGNAFIFSNPDYTFSNPSGTINVISFGTVRFINNSGTGNFTSYNINPTLNQTLTASGTIRGIYYNPTVTSTTGTHRAIETVVGDVLIGSTSGKLQIGNQTEIRSTGEFGFSGVSPTAAQTGWTISNPVTKRTVDVSTATLGDLREIVGTLLQDLIDKGIIKP